MIDRNELIASLLARPHGVSVAEGAAAIDVGMRSMAKRLHRLVLAGKAWAALEPQSKMLRWFDTEAGRDSWKAVNPRPLSKKAIRTAAAAKKIAAGRTTDKLMAIVVERGAHGTLPNDLTEGIGRRAGSCSSWITTHIRIGRVKAAMYRGIRILTPAGVELTQHGLLSAQARIEKILSDRGRENGQNRRKCAIPGEMPAGVTIKPRESWADREAENMETAPRTVCPAPKYDSRYQVDAAEFRGAFGLVGIGRDVNTGAAW